MSAQVDSSMKLNILSHLQDDRQALQIDNAQSLEPGVYKLENFMKKNAVNLLLVKYKLVK